MIDALAAMLTEKGVKILSIRAPGEPSDADPRSRDHDKWLVSFKVNDWHMDWTRGKPKASLKEALESAFSVKLSKSPTDLGELLG
jgi:hypothetical protein